MYILYLDTCKFVGNILNIQRLQTISLVLHNNLGVEKGILADKNTFLGFVGNSSCVLSMIIVNE